jgi:hypothetical protein
MASPCIPWVRPPLQRQIKRNGQAIRLFCAPLAMFALAVTCSPDYIRNDVDSRIVVSYPRGMKPSRAAGFIFVFIFLIFLANPLLAKCPTDTVQIRGKIECSFKPDDKVLTTLIFFDHQPEASGEETAIDIHGGTFDGRVAFNTSSSYNPLAGDVWHRRPKSALIRLIEADGTEKARTSLKIPNDFNYDEKQGEYNVRSAVILHGWCESKCTETPSIPCGNSK